MTSLLRLGTGRISSGKRRRALYWTLACGLLTIPSFLMLRRFLTDYATVGGGYDPGIAASDLAALRAIMHPEDLGPTRSELNQSGRLFLLAHGTRCIVVNAEVSPPWRCQGDHFPTQLKVLAGPYRGRIVWMCSDSFWRDPMP